VLSCHGLYKFNCFRKTAKNTAYLAQGQAFFNFPRLRVALHPVRHFIIPS
jgi:hypothetical protein